MATRYDILPEAQRSLLPGLAPLKELGFVLYGGTAIALRLGHRQALDYEFCTDRPLDRMAMKTVVPMLANASPLNDEPGAWTVEVRSRGSTSGPVTVSFSTAFGRVGMPEFDNDGHLLLASLDDILGQKLDMLTRRVETKDLRDVAALLQSGLTLERGAGAAKTLFPGVPLGEAVKALVYFEAEELGALSVAERAILVGDVARFAMVADVPLLSQRLDGVEPVA